MTTPATERKAALDRSVAAISSGDIDVAESICAALILNNRNDFDALLIVATIHSVRGRHWHAINNYNHALESARSHISALNHRGTALHQLGRFEEAVANYDHILSMRTLIAEVLFKRAVAHRAVGDIRRALADCRSALELYPDHVDALEMLRSCE
ncbi:tetratricopeptide repeat protein [Microbacteriaceae bacterium K1510]|nr:tetratricopeptide repeat protein [Microbacteriaceae bacterium K1510]